MLSAAWFSFILGNKHVPNIGSQSTCRISAMFFMNWVDTLHAQWLFIPRCCLWGPGWNTFDTRVASIYFPSNTRRGSRKPDPTASATKPYHCTEKHPQNQTPSKARRLERIWREILKSPWSNSRKILESFCKRMWSHHFCFADTFQGPVYLQRICVSRLIPTTRFYFA